MISIFIYLLNLFAFVYLYVSSWTMISANGARLVTPKSYLSGPVKLPELTLLLFELVQCVSCFNLVMSFLSCFVFTCPVKFSTCVIASPAPYLLHLCLVVSLHLGYLNTCLYPRVNVLAISLCFLESYWVITCFLDIPLYLSFWILFPVWLLACELT